jgi:hypothetical protein
MEPIADLWKTTFGKIILIGGPLIALCLMCVILGLLIPNPTVKTQPTLDDNAIETYIAETIAAQPTLTAPLSAPTETALLPTSTAVLPSTETPAPTATIVAIVPTSTLEADCIAAYPDFCIQAEPRLTCDELSKNFKVLPPDPLGYDHDGDGIGCEG